MHETQLPAMLKGHQGREMLFFIGQRTSTLHWRDSRSQALPHNGSAFFVRTEKALFGVTARHVYESFKEASAQYNAIASVNNVPIDLCSRVISQGTHADIVTFDVLPHELERTERLTVPWPPFIPPQHKAVLVAGYPGLGKRLTAPKEVTFGIYHAIMRIDSRSERDLSMVRPPDDEVIDLIGKGLPPRNFEMGGMSGGPVICPILEPSGDFSYGLAGLIYECGSSFEILKAVRADILDDRGFISD